MMRSLWSAVSGLQNHQTRMDVIGNNIANVNTVGFKASRVTFQDMLSQTIQGAGTPSGDVGGTNPIQIGMGMSVASVDTIFTNGAYQATGNSTDLAISGNGFFQLSNDNGTTKVYSRDGAFAYDSEGNYVVPSTGYKVMGYAVDPLTGKTSTTATPIQISKTTLMPGKVSTTMTIADNVNDSAKAIADITATVKTATDAVLTAASVAVSVLTAATMSATTQTAVNNVKLAAAAAVTAASIAKASVGTATTAVQAANNLAAVNALKNLLTRAQLAVTAVKADPASASSGSNVTTFVQDVANTSTAATAALANIDTSSDIPITQTVYSTSGTPYTLTGTMEKITANQWAFTPSGTVTDSNGTQIATVTTTPAAATTTAGLQPTVPILINFNSDGSFASSTKPYSITVVPVIPPAQASGPAPFTITPDFSTMTQYATTSTAMATGTDGYGAGSLSKLSTSASGMISGTYTNGVTKNLAQVAMFSFNNPGGLEKNGDNMYTASNNSGVATKDLVSSVSSGNLEMSNVDLSQQFSDMIVTQRGFQANSKTITTSDTMLEELVNLKR